MSNITATDIIQALQGMKTDDLRRVNQACLRYLQFQNSVIKDSFSVGQNVFFKNRQGETIEGIVISKGPKNVKVNQMKATTWNRSGTKWTVSPGLLKAL